MPLLVLALVVLAAWLASETSALPSKQCTSKAVQATAELGQHGCHTPVCGKLDTENNFESFTERLSPSCKVVMDKYQQLAKWNSRQALQVSSTSSWLRGLRPLGANWTETHEPAGRWHKCSTSSEAYFATNPVIVETSGLTSNFGMCTVPKAGCTLLRSLLYVATRASADEAMRFAGSEVHRAPYPTLWHYHNDWRLPDSYPTLTVGRNPYIRVVSGFLDKMVVTSEDHDVAIMRRVNRDLGREEGASFEDSREGFAEFIRLLAKAARSTSRNQHFDTAVSVCGLRHFSYRYLLRIEDMAEWYPCVVAGLKLEALTKKGWQREPGHVVKYKPNSNSGGCWWAPVGTSCEDYHEQTHDVWGRAVPGMVGDKAPGAHERDSHDTGAAAVWRRYYDQATGDLVYDLYKDDFQAFGYEKAEFR